MVGMAGSQGVLLLRLCSLLHLIGWKVDSRKPSTELELIWTVDKSRLCSYTGNVTSHITCTKVCENLVLGFDFFLLLHHSLLD